MDTFNTSWPRAKKEEWVQSQIDKHAVVVFPWPDLTRHEAQTPATGVASGPELDVLEARRATAMR